MKFRKERLDRALRRGARISSPFHRSREHSLSDAPPGLCRSLFYSFFALERGHWTVLGEGLDDYVYHRLAFFEWDLMRLRGADISAGRPFLSAQGLYIAGLS